MSRIRHLLTSGIAYRYTCVMVAQPGITMPKRSIEERNALVVDNLGLVRSFVDRGIEKGAIPWHQRDDAIQAGTLGLMRAADRFDASRGLRFSTFAAFPIFGELVAFTETLSLIRVWRSLYERGYRPIPVSSLSEVMEDNEEDFHPMSNDAEPIDIVAENEERQLQRSALAEALAELPINHQVIIQRRKCGERLASIAADLGFATSTVARYSADAVQMLRDIVLVVEVGDVKSDT